MKIDVFVVTYNEEKILPYFLRHYQQFATVHIWDNHSTDNTLKIAREAGVEVTAFETNDEYDELSLSEVRSRNWKESTADWVIVCDCDEFIYHPDIVEQLKKIDATLIIPIGYNMYSDNFPTTNGQIYEEVNMGILDYRYSKPIIFKPIDIKEMNFRAGAHFADPIGNVVINTTSDIKLLHMKFLSKEYVIGRYMTYEKRKSDRTKYHNFGDEYAWPVKQIIDDFDERYKQVEKILSK
jgi:glycosyltransferase involved in cell wall biosynthesis